MSTVLHALNQIKGNFDRCLPETFLRQACDDLGLRGRDRLLNPVVTTALFTQQILHGNVSVSHLRRLSRRGFTEPAYCQARQRLPRALLERLVLLTPHGSIRLEDVLAQVRLDGSEVTAVGGTTLREARLRFERDYIAAVVRQHHGRMGEAAHALGIQRTNLYRKLRQLSVSKLGPGRREGAVSGRRQSGRGDT